MDIRVLVPPQSMLGRNKRSNCRRPSVHLQRRAGGGVAPPASLCTLFQFGSQEQLHLIRPKPCTIFLTGQRARGSEARRRAGESSGPEAGWGPETSPGGRKFPSHRPPQGQVPTAEEWPSDPQVKESQNELDSKKVQTWRAERTRLHMPT